jgi:hypothetical protein
MITEYELQRNREIFDALNETKKQESKSPEFWLWSDLTPLYPKFLNKSTFIPTDWFSDKMHATIIQNVPAFEAMVEKPVHIKTINTNNVYQQVTPCDTFELEKTMDQKLTRLACEYLFKQYYGAEFAQAYFLFPNATLNELNDKIDDIKIYRRHQDIHNVIRQAASIILRVTGRTKATVYEIYQNTWTQFFNTENLADLKKQYNIKHSPFDNIQLDFSLYPNQWDYVYNMFRDMINQLDPHEILTLDDVTEQCNECAQIQRYMLKKHTGKNPEEFLTKIDLGAKAKQIDMERKQFWFKNYVSNSL